MRGSATPDEIAFRRDVGLRLRNLRDSLGLSLEGMANLVGIHAKYLGALERGKHTASSWMLARIAWGAGVEPGLLMNGLRPRGHPTRPAPT